MFYFIFHFPCGKILLQCGDINSTLRHYFTTNPDESNQYVIFQFHNNTIIYFFITPVLTAEVAAGNVALGEG